MSFASIQHPSPALSMTRFIKKVVTIKPTSSLPKVRIFFRQTAARLCASGRLPKAAFASDASSLSVTAVDILWICVSDNAMHVAKSDFIAAFVAAESEPSLAFRRSDICVVLKSCVNSGTCSTKARISCGGRNPTNAVKSLRATETSGLPLSSTTIGIKISFRGTTAPNHAYSPSCTSRSTVDALSSAASHRALGLDALVMAKLYRSSRF